MKLVLLNLYLISTVLAQSPCCVFNGQGAATITGTGIITLPGSNGQPNTGGSLAPIAIGAGTSASGDLFTSVIVGSTQGVEDSLAGWIITANSTGQTLTLWYGTNEEGQTPTCDRVYVNFPESYIPSTKLCCGSGSGGTFTDYVDSYMQGQTRVSWFGMNKTSSSLIAVTEGECVPVTVLSPSSPLGGGAFSVAVIGGGPEPAPAAWAEAPAACGF